MTIKDLMESNEDMTVKVQIDIDNVMVRTLYEGNLHGIPEELHDIEVTETSQSYATGDPIITIEEEPPQKKKGVSR